MLGVVDATVESSLANQLMQSVFIVSVLPLTVRFQIRSERLSDHKGVCAWQKGAVQSEWRLS
jgi:hypothetical protein